MDEARQLRLLIVEDEGLLAMSLSDMLEELGHQTAYVAADVASALRLILDHAKDLDACILDANLGGTSAAPVAAALREAQIPFIVVSGYGTQDLSRAGLTEPAIAKPYHRRELAAALQRL